jgi:hypothetical protein
LERQALICAIFYTILDTVTYVIYNRRSWLYGEKGSGSANGFVWGLSIYICLLNAWSYTFILNEHWVMSVLVWENAVMVIATFVTIVRQHNLAWDKTKISTSKKVSTVLCLLAGVLFIFFRKAEYATVILQAGTLIAIKTLWDELRLNPKSEERLPWGMWTAVYVLQGVVGWILWPGVWSKLLYPTVYAFFHGAIFVATLLPPKSGARPLRQT